MTKPSKFVKNPTEFAIVKRQKNIFDDSHQVGKGKDMVNQQKNCPFSYHQIIRHFRKVAILFENISSILGDILSSKNQ